MMSDPAEKTANREREKRIEEALDRVGRERVFDLMRANGWSGGQAPHWVWEQAIYEVGRAAERLRMARDG